MRLNDEITDTPDRTDLDQKKPVQSSERNSSPMRFGADPQITIPASGFVKMPHSKALQKTATRSLAQLNQELLASRAVTTEVLTLAW